MPLQHCVSWAQTTYCPKQSSLSALTAIDAVNATITVRKEKCIIMRGDESARVVSNTNSEDEGTQEEVSLLLYPEYSTKWRTQDFRPVWKSGHRC